MHNPSAAVLCTVLALFSSSLAPAQRGIHVDEPLGLKIKPPNRWACLGSFGDRGSLRTIYCGPRALAPKAGGVPHTPTMRLLWFAEKESAAAGTKDDPWPRRLPYTSFADYMARVHGPGLGVVSSAEKSFGKIAGSEILAQVRLRTGDLTLHTFSFANAGPAGGKVAVEFEVLSEQYAKLKKQFVKSLASLGLVSGEEPATAVEEMPLWETDYKAWRKLPVDERAKRREAWGKNWQKERGAVVEPGWKSVPSRSFLVRTRADSRFTKRVVQAAERIRAWVEKRFAKVSDDPVMPCVLRIFAAPHEAATYRRRDVDPREYDPRCREIQFSKDANMGTAGDGFGPLIRGIFQQYVCDKHPLIIHNIPRWLDNGLWGYMDSSRIKGKKFNFFASTVELGRFDYHRKNNTCPHVWDLIQELIAKGPEDGSPEKSWGYTPECTRLLRWFDAGGSALFSKDDFLQPYLAQIGAAAQDSPPSPDDNVDWQQLDEARMKKLRKLVYKRRADFLQKVNYGVIPLSKEAWGKADAAFMQFNAGFKR